MSTKKLQIVTPIVTSVNGQTGDVTLPVDDNLNSQSTNPVQNQVVASAINGVFNNIGEPSDVNTADSITVYGTINKVKTIADNVTTVAATNANRLANVEGKLNGSGSVTFSNVTTTGLTTKGEVEIYGNQPHLDFHYGNSTSDYTTRIIETASGKINIDASNGVLINGVNTGAESITLTANTSRITNASYTAKYYPMLGMAFVRIYGKINAALNAGYDYDLFSIGNRLPNSIAALSVKCGKNAMANAKTASSSGVIQIRPLESGINGYDVYITGFWFVD